MSPRVGPLRGMPGMVSCPPSHSATFQAGFFIAKSYGDFSSWYWNPGLGGLVWGLALPCASGYTSTAEIFIQVFIYHTWIWNSLCFYLSSLDVGPVYSLSSPLLPASMWLLPFILSCRTSVQLDFRSF